MNGLSLDVKKKVQIERLVKSGESIRQICRELSCDRETVKKIRDRMTPLVKHVARRRSGVIVEEGKWAIPPCPAPLLPPSMAKTLTPLEICDPGQWLILSDIHIPHHDDMTVQLAVEEAKRLDVVGIILNGDVIDSAEISRHEKHSSAEKYRLELEIANGFLAKLRCEFPEARIIYKEGNHESRLSSYVITHAPALDGLEGVDLPSFLHLRDRGIEWVEGNRVIKLGKLYVIHGHEYRGGGGVNPARWLRLRANDVALCGHFHKTAVDGGKTVGDYQEFCWATGCACHLKPHWLPFNDWNHGFATVDLKGNGDFQVQNRRVINGVIV